MNKQLLREKFACKFGEPLLVDDYMITKSNGTFFEREELEYIANELEDYEIDSSNCNNNYLRHLTID